MMLPRFIAGFAIYTTHVRRRRRTSLMMMMMIR